MARIFLHTAGLAAIIAWALLLVWAAFGTGASTGSSGMYMILGTVVSVLLVAFVVITALTRTGLRLIITGLATAVLAAAAGWTVYSSMPEAGPDAFITQRAGIAALAYGFGVVGGGLLALAEFVVEGYAGGRVIVPRVLRRKVAIFAVAVVALSALALAPAMQLWTDLANQDARVGDASEAGAEPAFDALTELAGVERFVETPYGMLRLDHPGEPAPQAVTLLDPATGAPVWYHRRWNWLAAQEPVLSHAEELVALTGPRADNDDDYQTRVLRTKTGEEVDTVGFDGTPGLLLAIADDRLVYTGVHSSAFAAYDFSGDLRWRKQLPDGCEGTAAQITAERLVMLADCVPAPNRMVARDHMLAFDIDSGELAWDHLIDRDAEVVPDSFLVTEDAVVIDSRVELNVSDGPFSARSFEHKLLAFSADDGSPLWRTEEQKFGPTHSSACGGTLHLSYPTALAEATGESGGADSSSKASLAHADRRTVQLVECYSAPDREGSWLGVMAYDLDSGALLYRQQVELGYTPLDPEVARGWATVLPDNRTLLATDLSLDPTKPDCRLYQVDRGEVTQLKAADEGLPEAWCHDAQLTTVAGGVAISYVNGEETRGIALIS
ncbi:outer membrane protein assembly factor BamB family protein [Glycomyces arizonensis]|uniref:outer membrane protein assembly factor BamB family protein n=1 Tax=Glycomyces arizonensis TaxID=256035 RepID=UPI0004057ABB|nr:PQQ-binding-like beta-propeller repeat protein [Glycomyces arizonensis]